MSENENLLLRLRQGVSGYSPTQQKLGEFVLGDPAKVLYLTITELARESETSEASVTRLCRTLGCKGYNEFKMALALDIHAGLNQLSAAAMKLITWSMNPFRPYRTPQSCSTGHCSNRRLRRCIRQMRCKYTAWRPAPFLASICITSCCASASPRSFSATCIARL